MFTSILAQQPQWISRSSALLNNASLTAVRHYALGSKQSTKNIAVLNRPIGDEKQPSPTDNTGIDTRTRAEKKADFTNYEKHLERRKEL